MFKMSVEMCMDSAAKYTSPTQWNKLDYSSYNAAVRMGILEVCCAHMKRPCKWTKEALKSSALNYVSRSRWHKGERSAYEAARRIGILDECCSHMN